MNYTFFVLPHNHHKMHEEIFYRMQREGLLKACMHSIKEPTLEHWLDITAAHKGWLLCCMPSDSLEHNTDLLYAVAWLSPWRGQTWTFDFTAFRKHFHKAPSMSKAALKWIFDHAPCHSVVGLCALSNRHAWRLAPKAGFNIIGKIPRACFNASRNSYEDAMLVLATKEDLSQLN